MIRARGQALCATILGVAGLLALGCEDAARFESITINPSLPEKASRRDERALDLKTGETLVVRSKAGAIEVKASADSPPRVVAEFSAGGSTVEEARRVLDSFRLEVKRTGSGVSVEIVGEPVKTGTTTAIVWLSAIATIRAIVPPGTTLDASTGNGAIVAEGPLGASRLESAYGDVSLSDAAGDVAAESRSGGIRLSDIRGRDIRATSGYGSIEIARVSGNLTATTASGNIVVEESSEGTCSLESKYGSVEARDVAGDVRLKSSSGNVTVSDSRGAVDARTNYGSVRVRAVLAALHAETGSGGVDVEALEGSRAATAWVLKSGYGDLSLEVPASFSCDLSLRTDYGSLDSDVPLEIREVKGRRIGTAVGRIGAGGPKLTLETRSGQIRLRSSRA